MVAVNPRVDRYKFAELLLKEGVEVIAGGFPCQDISSAGRGAGITGKRSGLWREMLRTIRLVRPKVALLENVAMLLHRGMGTVLGGLAESRYDAEWDCISAFDVGAPHQRDRIWIVATDASEVSGGVQQKRFSQCKNSPLTKQDGAEERVADSDKARKPQSKGCKQNKRGRACNSGEEEALANSACLGYGHGGEQCDLPGTDGRQIGIMRPEFIGAGAESQDLAHAQGFAARGLSEREKEAFPGPSINGEDVSYSAGIRQPRPWKSIFGCCRTQIREGQADQPESIGIGSQWSIEPDVGRVANGVPMRVDRLSGLGNAVVPQIPEIIGYSIMKLTEV